MDNKASDSTVATIGIDIGKNTFHLIGLDGRGAIVLRQKMSRGQVVVRLANMPPCLVGMEACVGAHHLSRQLLTLGHDVKLVRGQFVKPFLKGQKNDFRDAEAVASRLVSQRTAIVNQIRAFLLERGIAVRQGLRFLRHALPDILANRADVLTPRMVNMIEDLAGDLHHLDERIDQVTGEIETLAGNDEACQRLMTVPGIGPIIASAMVATIGDGSAFRRGRDFGAWLGLVPRQISTGDRTILGRISKRGNNYLRMLFVQAARVVLLRPANWPKHGFGRWLEAAAKRMHHNVVATALANKLTRIAWSVLYHGRGYEPRISAELA